jgi:hypothetical protein
MSFARKIVVSAETTATTNITGFLARLLGLSFLKDSPNAGPRMRASIMFMGFDRLI